jgi:hypothetical protein
LPFFFFDVVFGVLADEPELLDDVDVGLVLDDLTEVEDPSVAVADLDDVELDATFSLKPRLGDIPSAVVVP